MNKINYQKELDRIIAEQESCGLVPSLLLHVCCAPCSSYCLEYLSRYFDITVYYYNPNISIKEEYECRLSEEIRYISEKEFLHPVSITESVYDPQEFFTAVKGLEGEPEGDQVLGEADGGEAERLREEGDLHDGGGEDQTADHRRPEDLVVTVEGEDALSLRAHIEAVEDLAHIHREERHRHPVGGDAGGDLKASRLDAVTDDIGDEGDQGDEDSLIGDIEADAAREDPVI